MTEKLIMNLRDISHVMRFLYEGKASQKRILIILDESETVTQRELTERLGIKPGSASEILSKLENAGLIIRTQNKEDHRTMDICLTDDGRNLAAEALAQRKKRHEEMFSCLSEEEKQNLQTLLERVCSDWRIRYFQKEDLHSHRHHHDCHDGRKRHGGHKHHGGPQFQEGN